MKLPNLKKLHWSMKKLDLTVDVFDFSYNEVDCSILFNPDYSTGFSLTLFKKKNALVLKLPVNPGYNLVIENENFNAFCRFFEIKHEKGAFSIIEFFSYLNSKIPTKASKNTPRQREIISSLLTIDDSQKLHFDHFINWEKARAKNPKLKKGRNTKNLEKTRLLYPEIFKEIKNFDISVAYSSKPASSEELLIRKELNEQLS
ncbi:hypothetical protein D929_00176 [Enterococcus faecalis 02-MB-P-10]|uniref:DUF6037 family protein n=1 Tax=Enterococcus faecalis TaxID=1351 RepID=UPI0003531B30|nr:DUF6037 family protein [Enterococcus faecalis]EPH77107.1 hypothetical protein D929_00176 [Enterococcus faecalis 02-MB-P-10]